MSRINYIRTMVKLGAALMSKETDFSRTGQIWGLRRGKEGKVFARCIVIRSDRGGRRIRHWMECLETGTRTFWTERAGRNWENSVHHRRIA